GLATPGVQAEEQLRRPQPRQPHLYIEGGAVAQYLIVATAMQVGIGPLPIRLFPDSHGNHPPFLTMPRKKSTAVAIRRGQPADAMSRIKECEKNPPSGGVTVETAGGLPMDRQRTTQRP